MLSDPIGNMLSQIKNACMANKKSIETPFSKIKREIAVIMQKEGYIEAIDVVGDKPKQNLKIQLKFADKKPTITDLKRKSKPGIRLYVGKSNIPRVVGGLGIVILSTPQGVMTGKDAYKKGIGGEVLCEIW